MLMLPLRYTIHKNFHNLNTMMAAVGYSPATAADQARSWSEAQIQAPQETVLADFRACSMFDERENIGQLGEAPFPTTIISAADDMLTPPRLQGQLEQLIPRASLVTLSRAGHFCFFERPDAVAEAILGAHEGAQTAPRTSP